MKIAPDRCRIRRTYSLDGSNILTACRLYRAKTAKVSQKRFCLFLADEMAGVVESADCVTPDGILATLSAEELQMTYRHTALMEGDYIVTGATLRLQAGDKEAIWTRMKELMARRHEKQPLEYPSAGSFFKRPEGYFAGKLIQDAGLKGFTIGGAQISEKHAGFVINRGGATAADLVALRNRVQEKVYAEFGVHLETEVRFVGEF